MRVVALEEHYTVPGIVSRIDPAAIRRRGFPGPDVVWAQVIKRNELANLGDARLADMDASGDYRAGAFGRRPRGRRRARCRGHRAGT